MMARHGMSAINRRIRFSTRSSMNITRNFRLTWSGRGELYLCMCSGNSTITSNAADWNTVFYVCDAKAVIMSDWWLSAVPGVGALGERRGICPSCGARRMAESAALLVDDVLPRQPIRQLSPRMACSRAMQEQLPRVLSFPFPLRFLLASYPELMSKVLGIVQRVLSTHLIKAVPAHGCAWSGRSPTALP